MIHDSHMQHLALLVNAEDGLDAWKRRAVPDMGQHERTQVRKPSVCL